MGLLGVTLASKGFKVKFWPNGGGLGGQLHITAAVVPNPAALVPAQQRTQYICAQGVALTQMRIQWFLRSAQKLLAR
jgi:hypothetical protein